MLANDHQQTDATFLCHPDTAPQLAQRRDRRLAWALWAAFLLSICLFIASGSNRSVTPAYARGARAWMEGRTIYNHEGTGFLYLPTAAVIFLPFTVLPTLVADLLWRCFTIG